MNACLLCENIKYENVLFDIGNEIVSWHILCVKCSQIEDSNGRTYVCINYYGLANTI